MLPGWRVHAAAFSALQYPCLRRTSDLAQRPVLEAMPRTRVQIVLPIPAEFFAPGPDYAREWKSQSVSLRAAQRLDNRSRNSRDHQRSCKERFEAALPERFAYSLRGMG